MGVAVAATAIIGATPVGWAAVGVFAIGVAANMVFDYLYDNYKDDIVAGVKNIGNAVTGFLGDIGNAVLE